MSDERTAETPPGTPGQRALGAMESAVRRARASTGTPPLPPPPLSGAQAAADASRSRLPRRDRDHRLHSGRRDHRLRLERSPRGSPRSLVDQCGHRGRRPRRRSRHRVDRVVERQLGSAVLDGRSRPSQHGAAGEEPRQGGAGLDVDVHHHAAGCSGWPSGHLVAQPPEWRSRTEHRGGRSQLPQHERSDRGHVQRPGGADELPDTEHLHDHRAGVDVTFGPGGDHDLGRHVQCGDVHLRLGVIATEVGYMVGSVE